jgi:medium-chain acyl-[acyl-carrier-protein] hydrolase
LNDTRSHRWFDASPLRPGARLRLFCIHCAGGNATSFNAWAGALPASVDMRPVHLPGHGARFAEPPQRRAGPLVRGLVDALSGALDAPFALFGHSMGALLAFEVARELRRREAPSPKRLFVAAAPAPHLPRTAAPVAALPDAELLTAVDARYGSIPSDVMREPELVPIVARALRADMEIVEAYRYVEEPPLSTPLVVFGGLSDASIPQAALDAWRRQTTAHFVLDMVPAGHFLLEAPAFFQSLSEELAATE